MDELDKTGAILRGEAWGVVNAIGTLTCRAKVDFDKEIVDLLASGEHN
jgi:hypothetical protein